MAKKLNKKVAVIGIIFLAVVVLGTAALAIHYFTGRNPERNLENARQALAGGDYKKAEAFFGKAYAYGKTDSWKIERLFEMAAFHLIHNDQHEVNWPKALRCWNTVLNIDPQNIQARREMMNYFYQLGDSGAAAAWKNVHEQATELNKIFTEKGLEVDSELQLSLGRAALSIARIGGTTNPQEYLTEARGMFETLVKREPAKSSHYSYLADAILLGGELDEQSGVVGARETARKKATDIIEDSIKNAEDKTEAIANLYNYKLQTAGDAEVVEKLRSEIESKIKEVGGSPRLLTLMSQAYELQGKGDAAAELNRAIEFAQQAYHLAPEEFENGYRLAMLLYRKGSAFEDTASMNDALALAEELRKIPQTQDIPGPRQGRNLAYRNLLNIFLTRGYLEHAAAQPAEAESWTAKAEPIVRQIGEYYGSSENVTAQQWEGLLTLAQGKRDLGIRMLYRAYEQAKALDVPNQPSSIDPLLCITLAQIARQDGEIGLEREFLEKALANRGRLTMDKPSVILDYAELLARFQGWTQALQYVQAYQQRYGVNDRSRNLTVEIALATGEEEPVKQAIAALPENSPEQKKLELRMISSQVAAAQRQLTMPESERKTPEAELKKKIENLMTRQLALMQECINTAPDAVIPQQVQSISIYLLQQDQKAKAVELMDAFLAKTPDAITIQVLRRQADEPNPLQLPVERYRAIQAEVIETMSDPKQRAMAMAGLMRSESNFEKTAEWLEKAAEADKDNDADVIREQFDIAVDQEDVKTAESLLRTFRSRNLDGCDGAMASAQIEILKKDYPLALRRIDEALAIRPLMSFGYYLKSRTYELMADNAASVDNARRANQMNPMNSLYAKNYASVLFNRNSSLGTRVTEEQQNELIQAITIAIVLNPNDWQLQSVYAEVISGQSPDRALAIRQRLLQDYPSSANAVMLGNMAMRMAQAERNTAKKTGLIELSGKAFAQAMEIEPDNEGVKAAHAEYLRQTGQVEKAEELLRGDQNLLWRYYLQNGQFDKAEEVLLSLNKADAKDTVVLRGLVLTADGKGDRAGYKKYLDLLAENKLEKDDELWLIQKYLDGGFADETNTLLASYKERYPDEKLVLLLEAWSKMTTGQLSEAMSLTNRYLEADSENAGAWRLRGRLYRLMNDSAKAVDDLQRSKSLAPNAAISLELASLYIETKQIDAAIGELITGLQSPQAPLQLRLMLESLYQRNNRLSDLERFYAQNIQTFPDSPFWYYRAGQFYLSQKNAPQAISFIKNGWEITRRQNAVDPASLNLYLSALIQNQQYNDAITAASEWVDNPLAPVAYAHMANAQLKLGQKDKAESFFFTALDKAGANDMFQENVLNMMLETLGQEAANRWVQTNPTALPNLLAGYRLAVRNEQYNRGMELIDKCLVGITPDKPEWGGFAMKKANLLVQAYAKTADANYLQLSIELYEEILERFPNNPSILNNLSYMMAANDKQVERALQYARQAHQNDPSNPVYLDTYAFAQYKNKQYQRAKENTLRSIHLYDVIREPIPWDVYNHLGMIEESLGENTLAVESYQKAMELAAAAPEKERKALQERIDALKVKIEASR